MENIMEVFIKGGGIPLNEFDENEFVGVERTTLLGLRIYSYKNGFLLVPDVKTKLEKGYQ